MKFVVGSMIMKLLSTKRWPTNLVRHIWLDIGRHESVGGPGDGHQVVVNVRKIEVGLFAFELEPR